MFVRPRSAFFDNSDYTEFAAANGGTWRSAADQIRLEALGGAFRRKIIPLDITLAEGGAKIGQCCLIDDGKVRRFHDGLQLAPAYRTLWPGALKAVMNLAPDVEHIYGNEVSLEPCRAADLSSMACIEVLNVRNVTVHFVDLAKFESWEAYYSAISTNVKRNVKRAEARVPSLQLIDTAGRSAFWAAKDVTDLITAVRERKKLRTQQASWLRLAKRVLVTPEGLCVTRMIEQGQCQAVAYCHTFGPNTFYLRGGSSEESDGASWLMLVTLLKRQWERDRTGRFVLGFIDFTLGDEGREGLLRQRNSLRKSDFDTSIIRFRRRRP